MKVLKFFTWLRLERDFRAIGFMKRTKLYKKYPELFSFLKFRMDQNSCVYEIFLGIRGADGKHIA